LNQSKSPLLFLVFAVIAAGCAQQGSSALSPGQSGAAPAAAPADFFPYRFSGGTGSASYSAKGKDGTCSGTLTFGSDNVVYVDVKSNGDVDPGILATATLSGTSTCQGEPLDLPEVFELKAGSIKSGMVNDVTGAPPDSAVYGSFKMSGPVCDATVHLGRWIASSEGSRVQIEPVNITHVKQTLKC
jgi:hypothetical protein